MQTALYRIWTRVTVSIFYDDNQYTTSAFRINPSTRTECDTKSIELRAFFLLELLHNQG